jgi:oxygen-independent coproporphyrinogen III oxidase
VWKKEEGAVGIYVHVPFCSKKCNYCDFYSEQGMDSMVGDYFEALNAEIREVASKAGDVVAKTVYFGGGTPSLAQAEYIDGVLTTLRNHFQFTMDAEITLEANPGTLTHAKLDGYRKAGVNRLSIGLQAWQDRILKFLGRTHTIEDFKEAFFLSKEVGFENVSVDLIFGIPGQSMEDWKQSIEEVLALEPTHISGYSLTIEEGTVFGKWYREKKIAYPDDALEREMYHYASDTLVANGYFHYELSNFAKPGFESRHNNHYWECGRYFGFGAGAHSYYNDLRYANVKNLKAYLQSSPDPEKRVAFSERVDRYEAMKEFIILGLQKTQGVFASRFQSRFGEDFWSVFGQTLNALKDRGFLDWEEDRVFLTRKGLDFANAVWVELI